jgi:thioredoxin reductase (NADPH)
MEGDPAMHIDSADALVIGGGPAGLSAALYLARYNRSVIVFDSGHGRSTHHQINYNYLGFPGGTTPVKLRELGRKQLAEYEKVTLYEHKVERISGDAISGFIAHTQEHDYTGRVVVIATGVLDHFPHFHGWEPYVGVSMFWCITCDGYESKGKNILVVGHTNDSASEAMQLHSLTDQIQLLTNSQTFEITDTFQRRLANAGIPVIHDKIESVEGENGQMTAVLTKGGLRLELERMFSVQGATPETFLGENLGVTRNDIGYIIIDTDQQTNVPGVFAAGDITYLHQHQVTAAVHEGAQAGSAANYFLYPPELKDD